MVKKVLKVCGYVRVSTEEQKKYGFSIDAQIEKIKKYVELKEYQLENMYVDEGYSASNMKRPQLLNLLDNLDKIDAIIFTRLDRFSRNVLEANKMLSILQKNNVSMIAIEEEDINTSDADGLFMFNLKVSLAEREIKKTSERIKSVFEYKVKQGHVISGLASRGYKVSESKTLVKNEEEEEWVNEVFSYYAAHHSIRATMIYINDKYNLNNGYQVYNRILKNELYTGTYRGNVNYTEPYITRKQYERNQKMIQSNIRERTNRNYYLFTGLIRCPECNRILAGCKQEKKNYDRSYFYYRCQGYYRQKNCNNKFMINESLVEDFLLKNVEQLAIEHIIKINDIKPISLSKSENRKKNIKEELKNLNYIFMKKRIKQEEYDVLYERLERELEELNKVTCEVKDIKNLMDFLDSDWKNIYDSLSRMNKRALWRNIIKEIDASPSNINQVEFL